jgi:hypothetical protein
VLLDRELVNVDSDELLMLLGRELDEVDSEVVD